MTGSTAANMTAAATGSSISMRGRDRTWKSSSRPATITTTAAKKRAMPSRFSENASPLRVGMEDRQIPPSLQAVQQTVGVPGEE